MAVMDIFSRFLKKNNEQDTNFLALTLTADKVLATIWTLASEKVEILGYSKKSFQSEESIIHQAALAIDAAAEKAESDVSKVVFGLSNKWFEDGKIKKETSKLLEKMSKDLELDAQAYVSISSSIKNYLKIESGITPRAVLIGIFANSIDVDLLKNNQVEKTLNSITEPTLEKITGLVRTLGEDKDLPARIIVFGIQDDSRLAEELTKYEWKGILVSKPKIDFLKDRQVSKATAFVQATDILGHAPSIVPTAAGSTLTQDEVKTAPTNQLNFVEGEDVLRLQKPSAETSDEIDVENEDTAVNIDENVKEPTTQQPSKQRGRFIEGIATLAWFSKILDIFKKPGAGKKIAIAFGVILIFGFVGSAIAGRSLTKAEVVIKANSNSKEESFDVDVKRGGSTNFKNNQLAGSEIVGAASGNRKAVVTGTKEVGEKAKGDVTVFNWTTSETEFPADTIIISKNGIKFSLASDVSIASRSASTPGKSNVAAQAVDFGPEGNISGGTDFTFQEFDELLYSASNENAFAGGDKKNVTVVSEEDLDKLEESLRQSLKETATNDLKNKTFGQTINEDAIVVEVAKKTFDKKVDDEAALVSLDMEVEASTLTYSEDELKKLLAENANSNAPNDKLEARFENIEILSADSKVSANTLNLTGKFKVNYTPKFNQDELKDKIAGKSEKEAREIIKEIGEVTDVTVNFSPNFLIISSIPKNKEKITFKIES